MSTPTRLTIDMIKDLVEDDHYFRHHTLTICVLTLKNGAKVVGESNVIDPANFDAVIGKTIARENALNKIWQLEGYAMKTRMATKAV